jgi:hypothetical protein
VQLILELGDPGLLGLKKSLLRAELLAELLEFALKC